MVLSMPLALRPEDSHAVFHESARKLFGLTLYPLDWVSNQLEYAASVFAEVTPGLRRQVCRFNGLPDGLIGNFGASEFDFYNSRFRRVQRKRRRHSGPSRTIVSMLETSLEF